MRKILIGLLYLSLAGCKKSQTQESGLTGSFAETPKTNSSLVGTWRYNVPFYGSELLLKEDSTFSYHSQGCLSNTHSAGIWRLVGQGLVLTSYDRYRDESLSEEVILNEPADEEEQDANTRKGKPLKDDLNQLVLLSSPAVHTMDEDTTEYFNQQVLIFKKDSLYWFDSEIRYGKVKD